MSEYKITKQWDGVGQVEIFILANQDASIRYTPSHKFIEETIAKITKTYGNPGILDSGINSHPNGNGAEKAANSPTRQMQGGE